MKYYKDTNNKPFVFEDNVTAEILAKVETIHNTTLTEIILADYEALIAPTFAELQTAKIDSIKQSMINANNVPVAVTVTDITTGITAPYEFVGGYESAQMLDDKRNLVKESFALGLLPDDNVSFITTSDVRVLLSMAEATIVVLTVANSYEANFQRYKDLKAQISIATTPTELDTIVW